MENNKYLECGKIIGTHAVRGVMKAESYCNTPKILASIKHLFIMNGNEPSELKLLSSSVHKSNVLLTVEGVDSIEKATDYIGKSLYADRNDIPKTEKEVFNADIIGLDVFDSGSGRRLGRVKDICYSPSSDLFVIEANGREVLLPAVKEFIKEINTEQGVFVHIIEGFFDEI